MIEAAYSDSGASKEDMIALLAYTIERISHLAIRYVPNGKKSQILTGIEFPDGKWSTIELSRNGLEIVSDDGYRKLYDPNDHKLPAGKPNRPDNNEYRPHQYYVLEALEKIVSAKNIQPAKL